jgi:hypothetical protein
MSSGIIKFSVTTPGILIAAAHMLWPQIPIDATTVTLLAIAILPWRGQLFKTIELPGGSKAEYLELLKAEQTRQGRRPSLVRS